MSFLDRMARCKFEKAMSEATEKALADHFRNIDAVMNLERVIGVMKMAKPKKGNKKVKRIVLREISMGDLVEGIAQGVEQGLDRHPGIMPRLNHGGFLPKGEGLIASDWRGAMIPKNMIDKKRTPVRDYLRIAAIVLGAALLGNLALQKMSGPPKAARYQINHGPLKMQTDYAHHKPSLTPSGCVVWFDLKGEGNIFCGEFVIANIPGRIPRTPKVVKKAEPPKK